MLWSAESNKSGPKGIILRGCRNNYQRNSFKKNKENFVNNMYTSCIHGETWKKWVSHQVIIDMDIKRLCEHRGHCEEEMEGH